MYLLALNLAHVNYSYFLLAAMAASSLSSWANSTPTLAVDVHMLRVCLVEATEFVIFLPSDEYKKLPEPGTAPAVPRGSFANAKS